MPTYIKGEKVANATSYELHEKVGGSYNKLAEKNEINFEVSALGLAAGDHALVVKAKADGYEDSDYSNEVVYFEPYGEEGWYTGYEVLAATAKSTASYGGFAYSNDEMLSKLRNKPINAISANILTAGNITVGIVNSDNEIIDSVTISVAELGIQTIRLGKVLTANDGERPFVVQPGDTAIFGYEISASISGFPKGMDAYVGVKNTQTFANYNMNVNFGYFV